MYVCFLGSEDTLWTGTPADYTNSEAPRALSEVRDLVRRHQYPQATAAAAALTGGNPSEVVYYTNTISISIKFHPSFQFHA